jgi:VWFA-related protein
MRSSIVVALVFLLAGGSLSSITAQGRKEDKPIRISTELVQLDVVVTDKKGRVVTDLTKSDFELYENGKKQVINFFEFVEAPKRRQAGGAAKEARAPASPQGPSIGDISRILAFIVDDLTIRVEDLVFIRGMLTDFLDNQMQATDLIAIVRTVGGKGLLQQLTNDKALLKRSIAALTPTTHALKEFNNPDPEKIPILQQPASDTGLVTADVGVQTAFDISTGEPPDVNSALDDTNKVLRAYMSLGTASYVIDQIDQLPGRKSLVLISGGLPTLSAQPGKEASDISYFLEGLSDKATRAGVAIHTMDIRGLEAYRAVASFEDAPGKSMVAAPGAAPVSSRDAFGRTADEKMLGRSSLESHQGLRMLSSSTGGLAVLTRNNFAEGLQQILFASEGYYLLGYTPANDKFDSRFRKVEVKVRGDGLTLYSRRGYYAHEDKPLGAAMTKQEQLLAAIRSPFASRDINLDTTLLYKASPSSQGAIDIHMVIDPKKLQFDDAGGKRETSFDVAGFVFDELGKLRGGFNETVNAQLTPEEFGRVSKGGLTYSANTVLPAGTYQVRLAVHDNKSNRIGTMSRYLEVPDLSRGRLMASSLLLGAVPAGDMKATNPTPISATRQIARSQDLRYAVLVYNAKLKDGKPQVRTQLKISKAGKVIFEEPEEALQVAASNAELLKWGQLGLKGVGPGRYTLTLVVTDTLADKKANTISRSMDFVVTP